MQPSQWPELWVSNACACNFLFVLQWFEWEKCYSCTARKASGPICGYRALERTTSFHDAAKLVARSVGIQRLSLQAPICFQRREREKFISCTARKPVARS